jgi:peptidoglycan/LPS O-acetylase OafA/YrhL
MPDDLFYIAIVLTAMIGSVVAFALTSKVVNLKWPSALVLAVAATVLVFIANGTDLGPFQVFLPVLPSLGIAFWAVVGNHILVHYTQPVPTRR